MSNYLILGGAGFMGSNLVRALVARGERPRIFDRPGSAISNVEDIFDKVDFTYGDFMDDVTLSNALTGIDIVFHLVSTTFPSMTIESSAYDVLSNLIPTIRLVELCRTNGVKKIVYASSGGTIYGEPKTLPIKEDHPLLPKSAYGQSKLTIENYLSFYARTTEIDVDILRISNPYGPGQNPFGVQGLIAVAIGCAYYKRTLKIQGKGETVRDYIYIDDVIRAMLLLAEKDGSDVINISSGIGISVLEVVSKVEKVSGCTIQKEFVPLRKGDVEVNILSNEKAARVLQWSPQISFEDGLVREWKWINSKKSLFNN